MTTITIDFTNLESIAEAISLGITTPELVSDYLETVMVEGCFVFEESPMFADDGNAEIEYSSDTSHSDAATVYSLN